VLIQDKKLFDGKEERKTLKQTISTEGRKQYSIKKKNGRTFVEEKN
jgi:hypothetical protein